MLLTAPQRVQNTDIVSSQTLHHYGKNHGKPIGVLTGKMANLDVFSEKARRTSGRELYAASVKAELTTRVDAKVAELSSKGEPPVRVSVRSSVLTEMYTALSEAKRVEWEEKARSEPAVKPLTDEMRLE